MRGPTHIAAGVAFALVAQKYVGIEDDIFILTASSILGAIIPDICHPGSTLGRKIPLFSWIINKTFGHRTITHSLTFLFGIAALLWYFLPQYPAIYIGMFIGIFSHLVLDALTPSGIQLLYPLKVKVRFPVYTRTGSMIEHIFFFLLIIIDLALIGGFF
ncbi:metal-dependent hydrolase [Bacillus sp. JJ1127]|uniref:metal-dependent hydrolase n=1 Tax=Bacillus sp. JJ1127 TaxID=3122952 RepID=UPI002FFF3C78